MNRPSDWDDIGCNVQAAGLTKPELCHTKGSECCGGREGGEREGERQNPRGENMTSMCVGNGHAGEGNESTRIRGTAPRA